MLSYSDARQKVIEISRALGCPPRHETVEIENAYARILAREVRADRDYPPFNRSTRDGFAVRAADLSQSGAQLTCVGELRAGGSLDLTVGRGQCVEIMTGASLPRGTDAVMMVEYTRREGSTIFFERTIKLGENVGPQGAEAHSGDLLVASAARIGYAEMALAAQAGVTRLEVFVTPRVAIISTGDEVVDARTIPGPLEVRNSNGISLEVMARTAGARTEQLGHAPDDVEALRASIRRGLQADILILSGGVSMGKYDLVEQVLAEFGAEIHFTGTAIRPGRPAVFGTCQGKLVFGLPGNPVSTMVTFELFVLPAIDILGGAAPRPLPVFKAKLASPVQEKGGLVRFLPALVEWKGREAHVRQLRWQGSSDIVALVSANCYLVIGPDEFSGVEGDWVDVMPRRGAF